MKLYYYNYLQIIIALNLHANFITKYLDSTYKEHTFAVQDSDF